MRKQIYLIIVNLIVALIILTIGTYAWFTQQNFVYTEMYSAKVEGGDVELLISLAENGNYDIECDLIPENTPEKLYPVSTNDLYNFYKPLQVNGEGIVTNYQNAKVEDSVIYGTLYLKADEECNLYIDPEEFEVSVVDNLAVGLRLGIEINDKVLIFNVDKNNNEDAKLTIAEDNSVVAGTNGSEPIYVSDPSVSLEEYSYDSKTSVLVTLEKDVPTPFKYWVYVEGCDKNCVNNIQGSEVLIKFAFIGEKDEKTIY